MLLLYREGQVEGKDAALADRAFHAEFAAHPADELRRNGQAEAGAAELAGDGAVRLGEGLEDGPLLLERDADAGVGNGEAQEGLRGFPARVRRAAGRRNLQHDRAFAGELDGVADEVDQDLAQPPGVADDVGGHLGIDHPPQGELLRGRPGQEHAHDVADAVVHVEGNAFDLDLPRLDFREVEHVVDDREQGVGGALDGGGELPLLGGERRIEQEVGHADDAVHRRADLVAHVREKFALGAVGELGRLLGAPQLLFRALARRDVAEEVRHARRGLGDARRADLHREFPAAPALPEGLADFPHRRVGALDQAAVGSLVAGAEAPGEGEFRERRPQRFLSAGSRRWIPPADSRR